MTLQHFQFELKRTVNVAFFKLPNGALPLTTDTTIIISFFQDSYNLLEEPVPWTWKQLWMIFSGTSEADRCKLQLTLSLSLNYTFHIYESARVRSGLSDINVVIRWWARGSARKFACLPVCLFFFVFVTSQTYPCRVCITSSRGLQRHTTGMTTQTSGRQLFATEYNGGIAQIKSDVAFRKIHVLCSGSKLALHLKGCFRRYHNTSIVKCIKALPSES